MKELTRAEEQTMEYLWNLKRGYLRDIVEMYPEPRPAPTTVSTIIKILEQKGFVGYQVHGRNNEYYPLMSRSEYSLGRFKSVVKKHFNGSYKKLVSNFVSEKDLSLTELEELKATIEEAIKNREDGKI